jgi:type IV secretory pathway VirB9-like protein
MMKVEGEKKRGMWVVWVILTILLYAFIMFMEGCIATALGAEVTQRDGVKTVRAYRDQDIVHINGKMRYSTIIILPEGEEILDFTSGDKDFWQINGAHNLCYVHPSAPGIHSNLNLITASGHIYSFMLDESEATPVDVKVFVERADTGTISKQARYVSADELVAAKVETERVRELADAEVRKAQSEAKRINTHAIPDDCKFDYSFKLSKASDDPFLVRAICHKDKGTYIKSDASEKPVVYEVLDDKPNQVNSTLEGNVYVVPKVLNKGYLQVGKNKLGFEKKS